MTAAPITCPRCPNHWTGLNTAHCTACHQTFTGITAFDRHRDGKHSDSTRHCLPPQTVGLIDAKRDYPCWGDNRPNTRFQSDETPSPVHRIQTSQNIAQNPHGNAAINIPALT